MTAVSPNLQDLRARVLRNEEVSREEMLTALEALRLERSQKAQKKPKKTSGPIAQADFDLGSLFSKEEPSS